MADVLVKKPDGTWQSIIGPQGPTGVSSIIVGSFGPGTGTPATLPPDGALVAGFTAPGSAAYQMVMGESLYYEAPTGTADPLDGHLFQYITIAVNPSGWVDIGEIQGPVGPEGPAGPVGPERDEVSVSPDEPDPVLLPYTDIWYDTDAPEPPPRGMDDVVLKSRIYYSTALFAPWTGVAASTWTVDTAAGNYMVRFQVGSLSTGTGARGVNLYLDGVNTNIQSYLWFNAAGVHHTMLEGLGTITLTAGTHVFTVIHNGNCPGDSNDRGFITLIPVD